MNSHVVRIDPDGTVTDVPGSDALAVASAEFEGMTDVVLLRHPQAEYRLVGIVHDWGTLSLPLNRKAWWLYGGSPIYGPMYVADDDNAELDPEFVAMIQGDVPAEMLARMDAFLAGFQEAN